MRAFVAVALMGAAACSSDPGSESTDTGSSTADAAADAPGDVSPDSGDTGADSVADSEFPSEPDRSPLGGEDRPAEVFLPTDYATDREWPLAILLHGYGASALLQRAYLNLVPLTDELGYILVTPNGTVDSSGRHFWNAFPECCDRDGSEVDDVGYLTSLIDEAQTRYAVDAERVYFFGHSNGGFMSYRIACELGDRVAGIGVLAGSMTSDASLCADTGAVHVLHIHGTEDGSVLFSAAEPSASFWAARNGCGEPSAGQPIDIAIGADTETEVLVWDCPDEGNVELWSMIDVGHLPAINGDFSRQMLSWLFARPR
jgi:polyhydroxybutyrate depolymerase